MSPGISFTGEENYPKQPKWRAKFFLVIYSTNISTGLRKFRHKSPADRCRFATAAPLILSSGSGISSDCPGNAKTRRPASRKARTRVRRNSASDDQDLLQGIITGL